MCGYLENYIADVSKDEKQRAKDGEKIMKGLSNTLREGHHFDQSPGGVSSLFENLRANTQAQNNLHLDTSKNLTTQVLPVLERLHAEIKEKTKELTNSAGKSSKAVEAARLASQKHIELLGQHTATMDAQSSRIEGRNDPYVLHRGVYHRLNKQVNEENNNKADILNVQNSFQQFEAHVITTVQAALNSYQQFMSGQADRQKAMYGDMASTAQAVPLDFEWNGFLQRNGHILVSPNTPPRSIDTVAFPNQGHRATRPLIEGTLERKSRGIGAVTGYSSGYYVVTPAGFLHEYKDNDNFRDDPTPKVSLFLGDCVVGALDGNRFAVKGKDASGGKMSQKMSVSSDFNFKALTNDDAEKWHAIVGSMAGASATGSAPISPVETRVADNTTANTTTEAGAGMGAGMGRDTYEKPMVNTDVNQSQGVVGRSPAADVNISSGVGSGERAATAANTTSPVETPGSATSGSGSGKSGGGGLMSRLSLKKSSG